MENKIIEIIESNFLKFAFVLNAFEKKLNVRDENGKIIKVKTDQIVLVHQSSTFDSFINDVKLLKEKREALLSEIDTTLLWESLIDNLNTETILDIPKLTNQYFNCCSREHSSSILQAIFKDTIHFKRKGTQFYLRPTEIVNHQLKALEIRSNKEKIQKQQLEWLNNVFSASTIIESVPSEMKDLVRRINCVLKKTTDKETEFLLSQLDSKKTLLDTAFKILQNLGKLHLDADPWLAKAGFEEFFSPQILDYTNKEIAPFESTNKNTTNDNRIHFNESLTFSIDDEDTIEIDDAVTIKYEASKTRVIIHIADTCHFVGKNTLLDNAASDRCSSIYLPTSHSVMIPNQISCNLASLQQNDLRPTMSFIFDFDHNQEITFFDVSLGQIKVDRRLSYDQVDNMINEQIDSTETQNESTATQNNQELCKAILTLKKLTDHSREKRIKRGAINVNRAENKIKVKDGKVSIQEVPIDSISREIIRELMILTNHLAAKFASEKRIPIIYRVQELSNQDNNSNLIPPPKMSTNPDKHEGLGLDYYTQLTSPLRRYQDLIVQRQIKAFLTDKPLPYNTEQLMIIISDTEIKIKDIKRLEQEANRFWLLKYLHENYLTEVLEVSVIGEMGNHTIVETSKYSIRGKLKKRNSRLEGQLMVKIAHIDPKQGILLFEPF